MGSNRRSKRSSNRNFKRFDFITINNYVLSYFSSVVTYIDMVSVLGTLSTKIMADSRVSEPRLWILLLERRSHIGNMLGT